MPLDYKPLEAIDESDLQALVDSQVAESKVIDYKERLPESSDASRKEFLADVSSFANAAGGHLIYGMKEKSGVPVAVSGLSDLDADAEILRLENMIRDGIDPRMPGAVMRAVPLQNGTAAIVVRIPRSWALPHMVTFKGHSRFYSRNSAGKYPLDVRELRAAFDQSGTIAERLRTFRTERLSQIVAGQTPVPMGDGAKTVLHIVPFSAFDAASVVDATRADYTKLRPIYVSGWSHRFNFDGLLTFQMDQSGQAYSYVQLFRSGAIEATDCDLLRAHNGDLYIPTTTFEHELIDALKGYASTQQSLGVEPPLVVMVTLSGVAGYRLAVSRRLMRPWDEGHVIDRGLLAIPPVLVETYSVNPAETLRPIFDAIWNAGGWSRCMNYGESGEWAPQS